MLRFVHAKNHFSDTLLVCSFTNAHEGRAIYRNPVSQGLARVPAKPLYNLLDAIRLGNQSDSSSVDRFRLDFQLPQACEPSEKQAISIRMRARG